MQIDRSERTHPLGRTRSSGTMTESPSAKTLGWQSTCTHDAPTVPCVVFDPFAGSGTTLYVAKELGRRAIGLELKSEYIALARTRTRQEVMVL